MMLTHVIRAVIFDLDGTLVHSLYGIAHALNTTLERHQLPTHPEAKVRTFIGDGITKLVERACPSSYQIEQVTALTEEVSAEYSNAWQHGTVPYPEVSKTLHTLLESGIKIAVLSNKPHTFCKKMTDFIFPDIPFTAVLGQHQDMPTKPDPSSAIHLAKILALSPEQIAFVGDSPIDIITARRASMLSIAATWGYHDLTKLMAECPDHRIDSINELVHILNSETI